MSYAIYITPLSNITATPLSTLFSTGLIIDAEGHLLLAATLCYSYSLYSSAATDLATLTGAIDLALGNGAAAVTHLHSGINYII